MQSYLNVGGGFPWAEHVRWISVSLSAEATFTTDAAKRGGILPVASEGIHFMKQFDKYMFHHVN